MGVNRNYFSGCKNVAEILWKDELLDQLAIELVSDQVEGVLDMIRDDPKMYSTFNDVAASLTAATEMADDFLTDTIIEFETSLRAAIKRRRVILRSIEVAGDGFIDGTVRVE